MTTAVPSATPSSWAERTVVTPSASSIEPGSREAISSASRPAGSPASSGRIAGPVPSSAAASNSTSRGVACLTSTARKGCIVTIVKVRTLTLGGYA